MLVPNTVKVKPSLKPKPHTKMMAAIIRFLDFDKSTLLSTMFLTPIAEIIPYRMKEIPPIIAVGMVEMALDRLNEKQLVELDEERKAAMVSNLLVVLCGNHDAQPIVNTGSLY